jgi:hypothetical protein
MKKLENFTDLYEATLDYNTMSKDDALKIIRELVYALEDHNVRGVNLEQSMDYINEILGFEEE